MNTHIEDYLDRYLEIEKPDFAVMLKGEWGCGKTYFISEYRRKLERDKKAHCYVSLNGVSSFDDVVVSLLAKSNWAKKGCELFRRASSNISIGIPGVTLSLGNLLRAEDFKMRLKGRVLMFDDFERCKIDRIELLGFLSRFVEEENLHTIIIADEKRIDFGDGEYWIRKEKVVGRTLELQSLDSEIIPRIVDQLRFVELRDFLKDHQALLLNCHNSILEYCERQQPNYRIFKHALREFEFIFRPVFEDKKIESHKTEIFNELFFRYLSIFYCIQVGKIKEEKLKKILEFSYGAKEDDECTTLRKYFPQWGGSDSFIPLNVWLDIFASKKINHQEILAHIRERFNHQEPAWKRLWHYPDYDDSELSLLFEEVDHALKNKEYRDVVSILHIFSTLLELAASNFIDKTCEDVSLRAQKYLDELGNDIEWNASKGHINFIFDHPAGHGLREKELPQFEVIANCLRDRLQTKVRLNIKQRYEEFVMLVGSGKFTSQDLMDEKYLNEDIFSGSDPNLLWDKVKNLHPKKFGEFCRVCTQALILRHLDRVEISQEFKDFWMKILTLSQGFLDEHKKSKTEKSKCYYIEKGFIPELEKLQRRRVCLAMSDKSKGDEGDSNE